MTSPSNAVAPIIACAQAMIARLYETVDDRRRSWLDDLLIDAGFLRRCPCCTTAPIDGPCPPCADTADVVSGFDVYRCDPEASYLIPVLRDGDPRLEIRIAAVGGGEVGTGYADNHWIYGVWLDGLLVCSGADLRSGGIAHTHRHMAAVLAESLADNAPAPLRTHGERLGQWASDAQNPDGKRDHDV